MSLPKILGLVIMSAVTSAAASDDDFRHGRTRYLENGVTVQRATEAGAEEAAINMPFLPGDRVWTDGRGRAEFQFGDGSVVRLDSRSKLDYVAHEEGRGESVVLRLWSGGLVLQARNGRHFAGFAIETPGGLVEAEGRVALRIDAEGGETRLSVDEGEATLEAGRRRVVVEAGERTYARQGEAPERARPFDRREGDDFADWSEERDRRETLGGEARRYLPDEVAPYAAELESHGSWYYVTEVGNVWRPYVDSDWRPYDDGGWIWSSYGWTWVPNESWGWAPSHYGRWGYSGALGWYWAPGSAWGPAWVSWAVGGDYVGWCPLGSGDRPVTVDSARGHAVPRSSLATPVAPTTGWLYAKRSDMSLRNTARRRTDVPPAEVQALRVGESPRSRPSRDLQRLGDGPASPSREGPRAINIKPTIGDTVPELRSDPLVTIPAPLPRRSVRDSDVHFDRTREVNDRPESARADSRREGADEGRHPTDSRSPGGSAKASPRPPQGDGDRSQRLSDPDRDVLRHIFRPLSEPRDRGGDTRTAAPQGQTKTTPPPRTEPRTTAPPPRTEPQQHAAPPPPKPPATPPTSHPAPRKDNH
jgi:hypothetical protein